MIDQVKYFLALFMSALSNCALYSEEHEAVETLTGKAHSIVEPIFDESEKLEFMIVEDNLVVNKTPVRGLGIHGAGFVKRLKRKGLSRMDLLKGLTITELKMLISEIADIEKTPHSSPHIKVGTIDVRIGGIKIEDGLDIGTSEMSALTNEQVERVKEIYNTTSPFKRLNTSGLEEIVVNFVLAFKREANILNILSPVKIYSEFTYTHATNVAILTMFQAEAMGIGDELVHDIGIAALLHDMGKLFVSKDVLDKRGKLDDHEWKEMQRHTLYGARYLAKMDGLTPLAPILAFEHHMKYDGSGYPATSNSDRRQHICSQMVTIADLFDALRSKRPYKKSWEIKEILSLMKKNGGSEFNPFLVDNFSKMLLLALSQKKLS